MSRAKKRSIKQFKLDDSNVRIRAIPDASTREAMESFDVKNFREKIKKDAKIISSHKIKL